MSSTSKHPSTETPAPVRVTELELRERVKELECLYAVSRLAQRRELPLAVLAREVAGLLCQAWRYPELAAARVELEGQAFATPGFVRTPWRQTRRIVAEAAPAGRIELCYLHWPPPSPGMPGLQGASDPPFLEEEAKLLQAVAENLGRILESRRAEERLQALSRELIRAQETERQRIARELHDDVAQSLSMLKIGLESLAHDQPRVQAQELAAAAGAIIGAVRNIAYDLQPPGLAQLGLVSTIFKLCEDVSARCGLPVEFRADGMDAVKLDFDRQINIYRIVQEALSNVLQHAGASRVAVKLVASHPSILLRVEDNGRGFVPGGQQRDRHMGLWNMGERARLLGGTLRIRAAPGKGAGIVVELPLETTEIQE
ncbi:sensor histidine kinase [Megalodesulfovibrio gigas]|uniref:Putative signal transduction histidine kinase n=1 Tax=Megalodesulfovibrio gigas (strain ATCC 19364 / DSM 1382 / NCIMB 9332 / VKM B-1759) TaxID=1121448 RepID=T2GDN0_MEGG1|nr:sensor histidine kinase [Megalodesulfovibrio gigas]AGW14012.1 putative signal transduction histidine kinase [Megalodesulfovibrio gigas DSM 1382 = ATCC 19364]